MVMRNRILAITRGSIPYVPELRPIAGSVTATILMQQLDYWFERHPEGFYKFQDASPDNPAYKAGDSWVEELDFSVAELRNAFDQIGHRHKSKTEWAESADPFNGKFYCCYTDRRTRLTFYFRNHAMVDAALDALVIRQNQIVPPPANPMKPPIHAKSAGKGGYSAPQHGNFTGNGDNQLTGSGESQSPVNAQSELTGNGRTTDLVDAQSPPSQIDIQHSLEMHGGNSAYTETTGLQKTTQRPQQRPQGAPVEGIFVEPRGSGGEDEKLEDLVFPKAEPVELKILAGLVAGCRVENKQAVLDEVEGARQRGTLRAGIVPFARALVKAEAEGIFTESLGVAVRAARELVRKHAESAAAAVKPVIGEAPSSSHTAHNWTEEELNCLPPMMRERMLAKLGQGTQSSPGLQ